MRWLACAGLGLVAVLSACGGGGEAGRAPAWVEKEAGTGADTVGAKCYYGPVADAYDCLVKYRLGEGAGEGDPVSVWFCVHAVAGREIDWALGHGSEIGRCGA